MLHAFEGDVGAALITGLALQPRVQFPATFLVNHEQRAIGHLDPAIINIKDVFLGAELGFEKAIQFLARRICMALAAMTDQAKMEKMIRTMMIALPSGVAVIQTRHNSDSAKKH